MVVEISIKYGQTFKKGKNYHRLDLSMKSELGKGAKASEVYGKCFDVLKDQIEDLKKRVS